jgi:hypothetical protein
LLGMMLVSPPAWHSPQSVVPFAVAKLRKA